MGMPREAVPDDRECRVFLPGARGKTPRADVLLIGHHPRDPVDSAAWIRATGARAVIFATEHECPCRREQPCTVSGKPEPSICGWRKRACESSPGGAWNAVQGESRAFLNADGKDLSRQVRGGIHHDGLVLGGSAGEARRIRFGRPFQKNFLHGAYQIPVFRMAISLTTARRSWLRASFTSSGI